MSSVAHSRFIPGEEIDEGRVAQWQFEPVGQGAGLQVLQSLSLQGWPLGQLLGEPAAAESEAQAPVEPLHDEQQLQQMLEEARARGHEQGLEQGRSETARQWQQRLDDYVAGQGRETLEQARALLAGMDAGLKQLQTKMAAELLDLACDIARQVVRQELRSQPQALLPVVREALDMLVTEGRAATVRLHPADLALIEPALEAEHGAAGRVRWLGDPGLKPGDVHVEAGAAQVDAGLDKRWRRAVAALGLVSSWYEGQAHEL
ncbi:FliH/SctL family protein [Comamonas composti]|uniref:FliH/SctL family protein n=1 Tax=Comamonas composti TaxID=408558 RepID=UPI00047B2CAC|nr:FliH/SctL family protein [Comamonas composti]